jgi:hypothetical protein
MKPDGRLARNHLNSAVGDAIPALLSGAGHNLRLILRHLATLFCALRRHRLDHVAGAGAFCCRRRARDRMAVSRLSP